MGTENGKNPDPEPACFFCNATTDRKHLCYGCNRFICDACEETDPSVGPWGNHTASDHSAAQKVRPNDS